MEIKDLELIAVESSGVLNLSSQREYCELSSEEINYLSSIADSPRQEGYTCVTGCDECISCGGND